MSDSVGWNNFKSKDFRRVWRNILVFFVIGLLLWWAFRNVPFFEILKTLNVLQGWQLVLLLGINALVIALISARWWLIVRATNPGISFWLMAGYRLAAFGLSYFTPGPQVGGEPLQVIYLQERHGVSYARAISAVILDKLVEFLINFLLLSFGVWAVLKSGMISSANAPSIFWTILLAVLLVWPLVHLILLYNDFYPLSRVLESIPFIDVKDSRFRILLLSERLAARFCQRHTAAMLGAMGVSVFAVGGIVLEYILMVEFLGLKMTFIEVFASLTFLQLAFLVPLPGGLGAMEASQVFAFEFFGLTAASAISLALLQRGRDILNGGIGMIIFGKKFTTFREQRK